MAGLGRSFKPPAYFSRARRPGMPGRTMSNSSDVSVASTGSRSDDHCDLLMSGLNTPAQEKSKAEAFKMPEVRSPRGEPSAPSHFDLTALHSIKKYSNNNNHHSRPITIELPTSLRNIKSAPACTPPEPLSARGDLPGGYFPLHEDPKGRVHRPHPFHAEGGLTRHHTTSLAVDSAKRADHRGASLSMTMAPSTHLSPLTAIDADHSRSNTPVASYLPSGIHVTPLPMGKYYPSNYETRDTQESQIGPSAPASRLSSIKSEGQVPTRESLRGSRQDSDARRKLQQYQRDMIAQARLAANELLGGSAPSVGAMPSSTVTLNGVPLTNFHHLGSTGVSKPISPRLLPLGSPGPVTPMNLEGEDGGYLDRGCNDEIARVLRAEEDRIRREGATSPAVETGPQAF